MTARKRRRACLVCGPGRVEPCVVCTSTLEHRHLAVMDRNGEVRSVVAVCGSHAPRKGLRPAGRKVAARARTAIAKRTRDRARQRAMQQIRDRHRAEYEEILKGVADER